VQLGVAGVHFLEVRGEEGCLVSAGSGADFHDGVAVLARLGWEEEDLEVPFLLGLARLEFGDLGVGEFRHFGIVAFGEFAVVGKLAAGFAEGVPRFEDRFFAGMLLGDEPCSFLVREELTAGEFSFEFLEAGAMFRDERVEFHE